MSGFGALADIATSPVFEATRSPYLLVDRELRIRAVNAAYEQATQQPREMLLNQPIFDVFPDNPQDMSSNGVARLSSSFESVFRSGNRHYMGVQRYDVPDPAGRDAFIYKVWAPVNSPIGDDGHTVGVLHHAEEVTPLCGDAATVDCASDSSVVTPTHASALLARLHGLNTLARGRAFGLGETSLLLDRLVNNGPADDPAVIAVGYVDDPRQAGSGCHAIDGDGWSVCGYVAAAGLVGMAGLAWSDVPESVRCLSCASQLPSGELPHSLPA